MVGDFTCKLSKKELKHFLNAFIVLERVNAEDYRPKDRIRLYGISLPLADSYFYEIGKTLGPLYYQHKEILINNRAPRVELIQDTRKRVFFSLDELKRLQLSGSTYIPPCYKNKGILKRHKDSIPTPKIVSFDDVVYITPISPIKYSESTSDEEPSSPQINGENDDDSNDDVLFNPYLVREHFHSALNGTSCGRRLFFENSSASSKTVNDPAESGECSYRVRRNLHKRNLSDDDSPKSSKRFHNLEIQSSPCETKTSNVNGALNECATVPVDEVLTNTVNETSESAVSENCSSKITDSAKNNTKVKRRFRKKKTRFTVRKHVNKRKPVVGSKQLPNTLNNKNKIVNSDKQFLNPRVTLVKLNGIHMITEEKSENLNSSSEPNPPEKMNFVGQTGIPKRKRGRPKKNNPDPPFNPFAPKKKTYTPDPNVPKRKRGRPKKKVEFGFHTIVSDIKTITLPSDLWSAHVSVTSKRSQVCFTRVVQPVSDNVPVECDRSVKFNGSINYYVKINNRNVELMAAPKTVESLKDIEILLEIVNDININDTVLRYLSR